MALRSTRREHAVPDDGLIDAAIGGGHDDRVVAAALEEFAIEASLLKIAGSEMIDFVIDENVQIHGGNGFVADYPAERRYRDARVNRIFEGTNEINRLLVPAMLLKRAMKGNTACRADHAAKGVQAELIAPPAMAASATAVGPLATSAAPSTGMKKTASRRSASRCRPTASDSRSSRKC